MPRIKVKSVIANRIEPFYLHSEIQYREALIQQHQRNQEEYQRLEEHHRRLTLECQYYTEEYSPEKLQEEYDCHQQIHSDYEHLQQQLARCLASLEQNQQVSQQIQSNIDQIETEIDLIQTTLKNEKKVRRCFSSPCDVLQSIDLGNVAIRRRIGTSQSSSEETV